MEVPEYISHLKMVNNVSNEWRFQSNEEHSKGVAKLAASFALKVGFEDWGIVMGLLHDKGKEQEGFQRYIRKVSGFMPEIKNAERTPHAYVGALLAKRLYPKSFPLLSMPIMAHHAGLYDFGDFMEKVKADIPVDIQCDNPADIELTMPKDKVWHSQDMHHLVRVLYSCLVDADFLDAEDLLNSAVFYVN